MYNHPQNELEKYTNSKYFVADYTILSIFICCNFNTYLFHSYIGRYALFKAIIIFIDITTIL